MTSEKPTVGFMPLAEEAGPSTLPPYQPPQAGYPSPQPLGSYPPSQPQEGYPAPQPHGSYPQPIGSQPSSFHATNTTVVVTQPSMMAVQVGPRPWRTDLCACCEDCGICCMGFFCAECLLCDVSTRMGEGCCFPCFCQLALAGLRVKMRTQENIEGSLYDDYCCTICCGRLVLCQLARELKYLGK
ncbi:cornifelin homolog [Acropora millepora]|uniref:cornifelin homolog n=1 Tax=Acropora millepora TaxID=45264 RepID=UPI001CF49789|nr:cornifelin homolog [Acropora millepora]